MKSIFLQAALFCILFAIGSGASGSLHAQSPTVNISFRVLVWAEGEPAGFCYLHQGKLITATGFNGSVRSPAYSYSGPAILALYPVADSLPVTPGKPDELPAPIANIVLPAKIVTPLIILFKNPSGSPAYRAVVLDDSLEAFPFGSYLFINYSSQQVATSIGDNQFVLGPKQQQLITSDKKYYNIRMAVQRNEGLSWKKIYDDYYPNRDDNRMLFFMLDIVEKDRKSISLRPLLENRASWDKETDKQ